MKLENYKSKLIEYKQANAGLQNSVEELERTLSLEKQRFLEAEEMMSKQFKEKEEEIQEKIKEIEGFYQEKLVVYYKNSIFL